MMAEKAELFTASDAAAWTGGKIVGNPDCSVYSAEVDSRKCRVGCLFFALPGEKADGHDFIAQVFENGAGGAVVSALWFENNRASIGPDLWRDGFIIVVSEPLRALQMTAAGYMDRITGPVKIGVTGSNGKTTTKELIAGVLSEKYSVIKTEGNYNSEIGLPLTVFNIKNSHDYAVIEMGINRVGEMDVLSEILRPDIVVITNIGTAHIGIFNSIETIAYEKRRSVSLFSGSGTLFISEDEPFREFLIDGLKGLSVYYGENCFKAENPGCRFQNLGLGGWEITTAEYSVRFPLVGWHNLKNAFCAYSIGRRLGLTDREIKAGLEKAVPLSGRSQIIHGAVTIIHDSYNANADSLKQSIEFADQLDWEGSKLYVIGDMKELGESSVSIHRAAGRAAAESMADEIIFFGEDSRAAFNEASALRLKNEAAGPELFHTVDYSELEDLLLKKLRSGDLLLVKGSRSMNLERLLEPISEKFRSVKC